MFENVIQQILNLKLARELIVLIVGAIPIAELRGAIPLAIHEFNMPWYKAFYLSIIGNLIPVPFVLLFLEKITAIASRTKTGERFCQWVLQRTRSKNGSIERYKWIGLMLFVAIPLPLTGAWTASIIAALLYMKFWYAFSSIAVGVIIAGLIVVALSLLGWIGVVLAVIGLAIIIIMGMRKRGKKVPDSNDVQS